MLIKSLKISNILSIKDADLSFGEIGLVLLDGWNYDDGTANGAGKSALFNALSFGLYGKMPRDVTSTDYLRKGTKIGFSEVAVECGSDIWVVHRARPTSVLITKNGQPESISQEDFEAKLGLTYQQFLLTIYASQLKTEKFILLNDSGKKDFLLQLMNLNKFSTAKELATKQLKELNAKEIKFDQGIISQQTKIQTLRDSLVDPQEIRTRLLACDTATIVDEINSLSLVPKPDLSQAEAFELNIVKKRKVFDDIRQEISALRREREMILRQRQSKTNPVIAPCPYCVKDISISGKNLTKASDVHAHNQLIDVANAELEQQAANIACQINALEDKLAESHQVDEMEIKVRAKKAEKLQKFDEVTARIYELRILKQKNEQEATYLRQKLLDIQSISDKIQATQIDLDKLSQAKDIVVKERVMMEVLSGMFSPVGVQAYVADMVLDQLNGHVSNYISQMWPNASYQLLSYKENKTGDIKAKFSEKIVMGGREVSLGSLSGGELRCISLAVDLAVVDVVMQMFGITLNPLILDEPFDGMDNANRERAIDVLARLSHDREIWVIDHSSEARAMFSRVVRVEKRVGITSIVAA